MRQRRAPAIFGFVPEGTIGRRPSDVVGLILATGLLLLTGWLARHPGSFGRWTFEAVSDLPDAVQQGFQVVYLVGSGAVTVALVVACVVHRRWRLAWSMTAAAVVTASVGLALVTTVDADAARGGAGLNRFGNPPEFPAVRLAVAVSVLLVVGPYLTRPARRLVHLVVMLSALSAVPAIEGLPTDVLGSIALGWLVAAAVHLAVGTPAGRPASAQVEEALRDLGVDAHDLRVVPSPRQWAQFRAELDGGVSADIFVIGRDARDARVFHEVWREVWYRSSGADLVWTRRRQVEHWAYLLLLAHQAGARVPAVVAAGNAGRRDDALLVVRRLEGVPMDGADPGRVTDAVLEDAWRQLVLLGEAGIAKGGVTAQDIVVGPDGTVSLDDFSMASYPATTGRSAEDAVDLLVTTAAVVGIDRAVEVARRTLGKDVFEDLLPLLQPAALSRDTRRGVHDKQLVATLRERAAATVQQEPPQLAELRRVTFANVLMAAGTILGVYLLIGQFTGLSDVGDTLRSASWEWIAVAALLSQLPQIAAAFAMLGSVMAPLPLGPVIAVQYANNFTGLIGGSVANVALVVRFLQRQGQPVAVAVSSGVLISVASFAVQAVTLPVTLVLTGLTLDYAGGSGSGLSKMVILAIAVGGAIAGVVLVVPALRRRLGALVRPQWAAAKQNLTEVLRRPRKAVELFGSKLAVELLYALVLWSCVQAYGGDVSFAQAVFVNCAASLIGGAAPVPGGMGVVEAGLIAGLTAAGLDQQTAIAATLTHRMLTSYLPPVWGWFSLVWLRRHEYV